MVCLCDVFTEMFVCVCERKEGKELSGGKGGGGGVISDSVKREEVGGKR